MDISPYHGPQGTWVFPRSFWSISVFLQFSGTGTWAV